MSALYWCLISRCRCFVCKKYFRGTSPYVWYCVCITKMLRRHRVRVWDISMWPYPKMYKKKYGPKIWICLYIYVEIHVSGTTCWEDLMPWDMASALVAWCTRGHCLAVTERESPSDLALLDFISAPPGATKDIELVDRKLSQPSSAKWRVENWPKSIVTESPLKAQSSDGNWLLTFTFHANEGQANEKVNSPPRILMLT